MQVILNGTPEQVAADATVQTLLETKNLVGMRVAVEHNGEIIPRSQYACTPLHENDQLEIVTAVGGG